MTHKSMFTNARKLSAADNLHLAVASLLAAEGGNINIDKDDAWKSLKQANKEYYEAKQCVQSQKDIDNNKNKCLNKQMSDKIYETIGELPTYYQIVQHSQDIEPILEALGVEGEYGCLFTHAEEGAFKAVYGCESTVPWVNNSIDKLL